MQKMRNNNNNNNNNNNKLQNINLLANPFCWLKAIKILME
jgi:hypothetical protein